METSNLLNERLVCLSRVHSRAAAYVAGVLGIDLGNFHLYIQNEKRPEKSDTQAKSSRRKEALRLSASMVERLCSLHSLNEEGFTESLFDSWLVRNQADWERLNGCFEITPLLAIDSTSAINRLSLLESKVSHGLQLYGRMHPEQDLDQFSEPETSTDTASIKKENPSYLYQFLLAKVLAGQTWRAVLIRMTGVKLESLNREFWENPQSDRTVYHYQRRQNLFHIQQSIDAFKPRGDTQYSSTGWELSEFIRAQCYPIIKEHLDKRFDSEKQEDPDTGVQKLVLLGRPQRLRRYAQMIRQMYSLTPDRMNHLGATAMLGHQKIEVEVGCVFEEDASLMFRAPVRRKKGSAGEEHIVVVREHKNGLVEIVYNGPREYLLQFALGAQYSESDVSELTTQRVLHDINNEAEPQGIRWLEISLDDLRKAFKIIPLSYSLPFTDA